MTFHVPETRDHDWAITSRCARCNGPVMTLRRGADYGRQADCKAWCRQQEREAREKARRP